MSFSTGDLIKSVIKIYENLDQQIDCFSRITGLTCPEGCGACCENSEVEATVPELLPLAREIYLLGKEDDILEALDLRMEEENAACILYHPDPDIQGNGRCLHYPYRPLICRLFGFAGRKNKYNEFEFTVCKIVKPGATHILPRVEMAISNNIKPPLYQESAYRVAAIQPYLGFNRYPINRALRYALAYLQGRRPSRSKGRKAA